MKNITKEQLKKLQQTELDILIDFDKICKENKLTYILCGGTLLGAIRHNGFIPWDDDIDVLMPKKDYDQFLKIQNTILNKNKYYFQSMETDKDCNVLFGKIRRKNSIYAETINNMDKNKQGIWIDIFPLYNTSDNILIAKILYLKVIFLKIIISHKAGNNVVVSNKFKSIISSILKFISRFHSIESWKTKLNKTVNKYSTKDTKNKASYSGTLLLNGIFQYDIFNNITTHEFEKHMFCIPQNYDQILTQQYGDYMKLPPKEQQHPIHYISELKFPK